MNRKNWYGRSLLIGGSLFFTMSILTAWAPIAKANTPEHISFYAQNQGIKGFVLQDIKFFEAGFSSPERSEYKYAAAFPKSTTRYVWCEVTVQNLFYEKMYHTHHVVWKYYNPDGSLMGEPQGEFGIKPEWYTSWKAHGWGWDEPGNWSPGTYRAEVWIDNEKIGAGSFTIVDDTSTKTVEFESLRFFEGGYTAPDKGKRTYATDFPKSSTRYVFGEIGVKNLLYTIRSHTPDVMLKYYGPDGAFMGEAKPNAEIMSGWEYADLWTGWGWKEPGNWSPGKYTVEVWINHEKVGEKQFRIVQDELKLLIDEPDTGFRVRSSEDWVISSATKNTFEIERTNPECFMLINFDDTDRHSIDESMLEIHLAEMKKEFPSATLLMKKMESFKGKPSGWYEFRHTMEGSTLRHRHYLVIHNKKLLVIAVLALDDTWDKTMPYWQGLLNNMEFTTPVNTTQSSSAP